MASRNVNLRRAIGASLINRRFASLMLGSLVSSHSVAGELGNERLRTTSGGLLGAPA